MSRAAVLFGAAENMRKENRAAMNPIEQVEFDRQKAELAELSAGSGSIKTLIEDAWPVGRSMGLDELIAEDHS